MLDVDYLQPPIDGQTVVPMRLMQKPRDGAGRVSPRELIRAIYDQKYRDMNGISRETLEQLLQRTESRG